jgi:divalent metal cation (Fe/Co/Zn/Cd) transporter
VSTTSDPPLVREAAPPFRGGDATLARALRTALVLVLVTALYNAVEAGLALWSGIRASSVVLVGFGLDSIIECAAASVLLWRLALEARGASATRIRQAERTVRRFIGATFIALAVYVVGQAGYSLLTVHAPTESWLGIGLAVASLTIMPVLALWKLRIAARIGSAALRAEAKETLACSYLSFTLLLGLVANAMLGWWWADPVAALVMVPWLVKEGREGLAGDDCCA